MPSEIDVTPLAGGAVLPVSNPTGYLVSRPGTAAAALKEILEGFLIDARETNCTLQFIPRARPVIVQSSVNQWVLPVLGNTDTAAFTSPNVPGNILVAFTSLRGGMGVPSISDTSLNSWTPIFLSGSTTDGTVPSAGAWWCVANSSISLNTIAFAYPGGVGLNDNFGGYAIEIGGPNPPAVAASSGTGALASATVGGYSISFTLAIGTPWNLALLELDAGGSPPFLLALMSELEGGGAFWVAGQDPPTGWTDAFPSSDHSSTAVLWRYEYFTVPEGDLGLEKDKAKLVEALAQENDLPQAVTVLYNDATLNYQQGKQLKGRNPRIVTIETKNQKILSLPFTLMPQQARQLAEAHLYSDWENRASYAINLWRALYLLLDPGDWIQFTYEGLLFTARLLSCDVGRGAVIGLACVADDPRDYVSSVVGGANLAFVGPVTRTLAQTILYILDMPLLRDSDANPGGSGFYAAMGSSSIDWLAAALYGSSDDVKFTLLDSSDGPVAFGGALTILAAPRSPWDWDTVNSLTVQMQSGTLAGDTDVNVLNGSNALIVGSEVIQFANCVNNGGGSYTISRLLRGRRGTEWACGTHGTNETVIAPFAVGEILREQRPLSEIGSLRYYRGVTSGDLVADAPDNDLTLAGNDLKPYAPCHIGGFLDVNSNVIITWMRRTRIGWAGLSQDPVPLSEDSELYDVDILNGSGVVIRTIANVTVPTAMYLATEVVTDFGSLPANGITVNIYQKSGEVGRGFAGTGVVPTPGGWPIPLPATLGVELFHVNGS